MDRVLVQRVKPQQKTASGILIPEKAQEALNEGVVKAVGPGIVHPQTGKKIEMALKEGDRVMLPQFGGSPVKSASAEEDMLLFRESEILAKIQE